MDEEKRNALFMKEAEVNKLKTEFVELITKYFSLIELETYKPSDILKSCIHLHNVFHPEKRLNDEVVLEVAQACDKRKEADEDRKKASTAKKTTKGSKEKKVLTIENLASFLEGKKPYYGVNALKQLSTNKNLIGERSSVLAMLKEAEQKLENRIKLLKMLSEQLKSGKSLRELLKQRLFETLVGEVRSLGNSVDAYEYTDKKKLVRDFFFALRNEDSQRHELLHLRILFLFVKNESNRTILQELYKKWPQKDERKERILILRDLYTEFPDAHHS